MPYNFILTFCSFSSLGLFWAYVPDLHYTFVVYLLAFERKFKWCNYLVTAENISYMPCEGSVFIITDILQQDLLLWIPHISHVEKTGIQA